MMGKKKKGKFKCAKCKQTKMEYFRSKKESSLCTGCEPRSSLFVRTVTNDDK